MIAFSGSAVHMNGARLEYFVVMHDAFKTACVFLRQRNHAYSCVAWCAVAAQGLFPVADVCGLSLFFVGCAIR